MTAFYRHAKISRAVARRYFPTKASLLDALTAANKSDRSRKGAAVKQNGVKKVAPADDLAQPDLALEVQPNGLDVVAEVSPQKDEGEKAVPVDPELDSPGYVDEYMDFDDFPSPPFVGVASSPYADVTSPTYWSKPPLVGATEPWFADLSKPPFADLPKPPFVGATEPSPVDVAKPPFAGAAETPEDSGDWIERRFRVFERAVSALETRVEQLESKGAGGTGANSESGVSNSQLSPENFVISPGSDGSKTTEQADASGAAGGALPVGDKPELLFEQVAKTGPSVSNRRSAGVVGAYDDWTPVQRWYSRVSPLEIALIAIIAVAAITTIAILLGGGLGKHAAPANTRMAQRPAVTIINATGKGPVTATSMLGAAESGDPQAQTKLAVAYLKGALFPEDPVSAARWSQTAAEQGDAEGAFVLGNVYANGIKPNPELAYKWYSVAAAQGNAKAKHNLGIALLTGTGVEPNAAEAANWFMRAASSDIATPAFDLAVLFERGDGVARNPLQAYRWYNYAAAQGDDEAKKRAEFLKENVPQLASN